MANYRNKNRREPLVVMRRATDVDWRVVDQEHPVGARLIINGMVCVVRMDRRRQSENCVACAVKVANEQQEGVVTCANLKCERGERSDRTNVHFERLGKGVSAP